MLDRKAVFASERAAFEADHPELAHQIPLWSDIAARAFGVRLDAIEERARQLEADGAPASPEQIANAVSIAARLSLVDTAARWQSRR